MSKILALRPLEHKPDCRLGEEREKLIKELRAAL